MLLKRLLYFEKDDLFFNFKHDSTSLYTQPCVLFKYNFKTNVPFSRFICTYQKFKVKSELFKVAYTSAHLSYACHRMHSSDYACP